MRAPFEVWFRLSPSGKGTGVSCCANGAYVGPVPLLERKSAGGWEARQAGELNAELTACFGLPVDVTCKAAGLAAIARALSGNNVVQAQIATLHLQFPDPPELAKGTPSPIEAIVLAKLLRRSGLLKADWDSAKHPRWPAGDSEGRGGEFAPAGSGGTDSLTAPVSDRQPMGGQTNPRVAPVSLPFPLLSSCHCRVKFHFHAHSNSFRRHLTCRTRNSATAFRRTHFQIVLSVPRNGLQRKSIAASSSKKGNWDVATTAEWAIGCGTA